MYFDQVKLTVIFRNVGKGVFEELIDQAGPGIAAAHSSRGCAFGDFDNDGDLDILVANLNEPPSLLRNDLHSANDPRLHFGLGTEKTADIEIYWPSALKQQLKSIVANQLVTVKEGSAIIPGLGWPRR